MKLKMSKKVQIKELKLMDAGQHPNKVPFTCSLFAVDTPSDGSPEGANGKLIRISSAVCDQFLDTFTGMGMNIDFSEGMSDHDTRFKVGIITKTFRSMDGKAMAEGYLWGKDFPDVVATIRYYNNLASEWNDPDFQFGSSIEMEAKVTSSEDENVLDVTEFTGTGAAILFAEAAAYKTTTFAAKNKNKEDEEMKPEEMKALLDGLKKDIAASVAKSVDEVKTEIGTIKTEVETMKAAAKEKEKTETENAELKAAQEKTVQLEKELAELKAKQQVEPQRKTATPANLLAKYASAQEGDAENYTSFCAAIDRLNLSSSESLRLKMQAKNEFAKEAK